MSKLSHFGSSFIIVMNLLYQKNFIQNGLIVKKKIHLNVSIKEVGSGLFSLREFKKNER
jgi:hypothetical protein